MVFAETLALYGVKAKTSIANTIGALLFNPLSGNNMTKNLMIDIETGGLATNAPMLEFAMSDGKSDTDLKIFPVSVSRDRSVLDASGKLVKPTYKYSAEAILSETQFKERFGTWAFEKEFGLETLYGGLSKLPEQELARLKTDALIKDTLDLTQYGLQGGGTFTTPRGVAKTLIGELESLSKTGGNLLAANIPFESARLGDVLAYYMDPDNPHNILGEVSMDEKGLRNLFEATYKFEGKKNILDANNLSYIKAMRSMEASQGSIGNLIDLWPKFLERSTKVGARNIDIQTISRMLFSGTNAIQYGLALPGKDIYSGASIDFATNLLFGEKELHHAISDVKHQQRTLDITASAVNKLYYMQQGLKPGASVLQQLKGLGSATMGLWDKGFQKALTYAESRHMAGSYMDMNLGILYEGKAYNMLRQRNLHRSLSILGHTLDAWLNHVDNIQHTGPIQFAYNVDPDTGLTVNSVKGEPFTVTKQQTKHIDYIDRLGNTFKEHRGWATDTNLAQDTIRLYGELRDQHGPTEARRLVEESVLEKYYKSRFFESSDLSYSLQDLKQEYMGLKPVLNTEGAYNLLTAGDKDFKEAVIRVAQSKSADDLQYLKFFGRTYAKQIAVLGGIGAIALGVGAPMVSQIIGKKEASYVESQDISRQQVPAYMAMGISTVGHSEEELYKQLTEEEHFDWRTKRIFASGTIAHEYEEVQRLKSGGAVTAEAFVANYDMNMSSFVDIVYEGNIPSDVKTASPNKMERIRKYGADRKNVSQLNFYMAQMGASHGYLEYQNRIDPSDREKIRVEFNPYLYQHDVAKVARVRARIESELASGKLNIEDLPKADTMEMRALEAQERQSKLLRMASRPVNPILEMKQKANLILDRAIYYGDERFERTHGVPANPYVPEPRMSLDADFFAADPSNKAMFNRARNVDDYADIAWESYNRDRERKEGMASMQNAALYEMMSGNPGRDARRRA